MGDRKALQAMRTTMIGAIGGFSELLATCVELTETQHPDQIGLTAEQLTLTEQVRAAQRLVHTLQETVQENTPSAFAGQDYFLIGRGLNEEKKSHHSAPLHAFVHTFQLQTGRARPQHSFSLPWRHGPMSNRLYMANRPAAPTASHPRCPCSSSKIICHRTTAPPVDRRPWARIEEGLRDTKGLQSVPAGRLVRFLRRKQT